MLNIRMLTVCLGLSATPIQAGAFLDGLFTLADKISPLLDYVPSEESIEPICDFKLLDVVGVNSMAANAAAVTGIHSTTTITQPALALVPGHSGLTLITGTRITTITVPLVGPALATAATAATTVYIGGKGLCALSAALSNTHITNEPIPLVMFVEHQNPKFGDTDEDRLLTGKAEFVKTNEIIPAGTPVLSLGLQSKGVAAQYPDYEGHGLIKLGRFFDHVYETDIPEEKRGFAVVPANSLNALYKEKYTHQFTEDTLVEINGKQALAPAGTPLKLHKRRDDGWAKIELADGWNIWVKDFSNAVEINLEFLQQAGSEPVATVAAMKTVDTLKSSDKFYNISNLELCRNKWVGYLQEVKRRGFKCDSPNYDNKDAIETGFKNESVPSRKKIQKALKELNFYTSSIDAKYGPGTEKAIIEYAKSKTLSTDDPTFIFSTLLTQVSASND